LVLREVISNTEAAGADTAAACCPKAVFCIHRWLWQPAIVRVRQLELLLRLELLRSN